MSHKVTSYCQCDFDSCICETLYLTITNLFLIITALQQISQNAFTSHNYWDFIIHECNFVSPNCNLYSHNCKNIKHSCTFFCNLNYSVQSNFIFNNCDLVFHNCNLTVSHKVTLYLTLDYFTNMPLFLIQYFTLITLF